ncbi:hypothetical protein BVU76_27535 [Mycolicibacterium porcinum]|nr:hypothetical protein BVU76_27535 [Mycolicibacterium porcinum]
MFEQFTNEARKIVIAAQQHARARRHNYLGTAHLLLALTDDQAEPVAQAFSALDVATAELRAHLNDSNPPGTQQPSEYIPFTSRCKTAITHSYAEAIRTNQSVDVAALGVGLTLVEGGAAAQTLRHFTLAPARLRDQLISLRGSGTPAPADVPTVQRPHGYHPRDATELTADQLAIVSVTYLEDRGDQALVRLPGGSHTSVPNATLTPVPDNVPTTPWSSVFGIHMHFLGDHDGQALIRLPDQTQTVVDYTALTIPR